MPFTRLIIWSVLLFCSDLSDAVLHRFSGTGQCPALQSDNPSSLSLQLDILHRAFASPQESDYTLQTTLSSLEAVSSLACRKLLSLPYGARFLLCELPGISCYSLISGKPRTLLWSSNNL